MKITIFIQNYITTVITKNSAKYGWPKNAYQILSLGIFFLCNLRQEISDNNKSPTKKDVSKLANKISLFVVYLKSFRLDLLQMDLMRREVESLIGYKNKIQFIWKNGRFWFVQESSFIFQNLDFWQQNHLALKKTLRNSMGNRIKIIIYSEFLNFCCKGSSL